MAIEEVNPTPIVTSQPAEAQAADNILQDRNAPVTGIKFQRPVPGRDSEQPSLAVIILVSVLKIFDTR